MIGEAPNMGRALLLGTALLAAFAWDKPVGRSWSPLWGVNCWNPPCGPHFANTPLGPVERTWLGATVGPHRWDLTLGPAVATPWGTLFWARRKR